MKVLSEEEIKQEIFNILSVFADYCDANGLRYYLCGGTLLGAIRHKDFIPWDDDVDILMPRPDYIRLHELMETVPMGTNYKIISWQNGNAPFPFGKIVNTETTVKCKFNEVDRYLWIDIFPMDGVPSNEYKCNKLLGFAQMIKSLHAWSNTTFGTGVTLFRSVAKIPGLCIGHLLGTKRLARKLNKLAQQYDFETSEYVAGISWSRGPRERMKKDEFIQVEEVLFHGRTFHAPACWDFYLKAMFGDYMKLPPEKSQHGHGIQAYK